MLLGMLRLCIQYPQMSVLKERMVALDALAQEEANLRCKECSNSSLREYYRGGLTVSAEFFNPPGHIFLPRFLNGRATSRLQCTLRGLRSRLLT